MIGLLQRVTHATVHSDGELLAQIQAGLLVLVGIRKNDDKSSADRLLQRILTYRMFADEQGKMNRNLQDIGGGLLLVPQFSLAADTRKGTRASFTSGAGPDQAQELFEYLCERAKKSHTPVSLGRFAADMQVSLVNDGPVTFWLES